MKFILNEDWHDYLEDVLSDKETSHKAHIIMIDELGDEVDCGEISFFGDEDCWEIYQNKKLERFQNRYPEASGFYVEDRTTWNRMDDYYERQNEFLNDFYEDTLIPDLQDEDKVYTEDEFCEITY